jgi:hypothetical protein
MAVKFTHRPSTISQRLTWREAKFSNLKAARQSKPHAFAVFIKNVFLLVASTRT